MPNFEKFTAIRRYFETGFSHFSPKFFLKKYGTNVNLKKVLLKINYLIIFKKIRT